MHLFHQVCTLSGVFVEMYDNCDIHIFWIGATEAESAKSFKEFVFKETSQFIKLDECGVPLHPVAAQRMGRKYSHVVLHHLSVDQFSKITGHLTQLLSGVIGTHHNTWSQAAGCPCLGHLLQVQGSGFGHAHAEFWLQRREFSSTRDLFAAL